jgi:hypothetical protein
LETTKRSIAMQTISRDLRVAGAFVALCILSLTINSNASPGDFYTSYTNAKVIAHVPLTGASPQQMFLQQLDRREYLYLQQSSRQGFTVLDVSKPAKPKIVAHVPQQNLTVVASGLALTEAHPSGRPSSSGTNENVEGAHGGGSAPRQVRVLDVSDPAHPRTVQNFTGVTSILPDNARGLIYVANGKGIWILSHQKVLRRHLCSSSDAISSAIPNCD